MFTSDRRELIKKLVTENKRVDVASLSEEFLVSEVTIRKDLEHLEKQGVLIRTYGGAILNEMASPVDSDFQTVSEDIHSKAIGKLIPYLINEGDLLYLGPGSLCTEIARNLREKSNLTIITNNLTAAIELSENQNIRIITPPGQLIRNSGYISTTGPEVLAYLEKRFIDKAIVAADAVRFSVGFTMQDDALCRIASQMLLNADQRIIAISSENFNKNAFSVLGDLKVASTVVSDERMPDDYLSYFYASNIRVFTSYDIEDL